MDLVYKITADLDGLPSGGGAGEAGSSSGGRSSGGGNFSPNANHHTAVSSRRRSISDIDDSYSGNGFLMGSAVAMLGDKSATRRVEHKVMVSLSADKITLDRIAMINSTAHFLPSPRGGTPLHFPPSLSIHIVDIKYLPLTPMLLQEFEDLLSRFFKHISSKIIR